MDEDKRSWHLLSVTVAREAEETASVIMFDLGTSGVVTLEEAEESIKLGAYFDQGRDPEEIARRIESEFARQGRAGLLFGASISEIAEQDWMQKWKEGFDPFEAGDRLVIAPSWKLPAEPGDRLVIQIDPGMAFGTGTHETTRLCLQSLESFWHGGRLLDVGTGTGILAIAAAMLAPGSSVTAIDIDPQAVEVARENVEINRTPGGVLVVEGEPRDFRGGCFDVVVANLTAEVIIELMDDLVGCLARQGLLILSGILAPLLSDVEQMAVASGLSISERRVAGEWAALIARREG
jgi:ribosomal protein L11 methyltransferase